MKINRLLQITFFAFTLTFAILYSEAAKKAITCDDIGSSGTKSSVYSMSDEEGDYIQLFTDYVPVHYTLDLEKSVDNNFSDAIINKGIRAIKIVKEYVEAKYGQNGEIEYYGIATGAWRKEDNGKQLQALVYKETGVPIKIITQKEEAELGYEGVASKVKSKDIVVWDIGGGSMQFVSKSKHEGFKIAKGTLAAQTFTNMVRNEVKQISQDESPKPMSVEEVEQSIRLAQEHLGFKAKNEQEIKRIITDQGGIVYGISPLHKYVVPRTLDILTGKAHKSFTRSDLKYAIEILTDQGDDTMAKFSADKPNPEFTKSHLTALILVYAVMEKMGIEKVIATETSSLGGLVSRGPAFVLGDF